MKKKLIRRSFAYLVLVILLLSQLTLPVRAATQTWRSRSAIGRADHAFVDLPYFLRSWEPSINGEAAILVELNSGFVLYEKNMHQQMYPASTTKVMTALMAIENLSFDDTLTISYNATHDLIEGGFDGRFEEGQVFTIEEALYGLCLNSVNTLGYALAEKMADDVPSFAGWMNARAAALGAQETHFTNPHGLNDVNHVTSAYDMAKILWTAIEYDDYRRIAGTEYYSCAEPKNGTVMNFTHTLSFLHPDNKWYDPRVVCGKTGWTEDASFCRAIYATDGNRDLICVVFHSEGGYGDNIENDVETLLNYGFSFMEAADPTFETDYIMKGSYITGVAPETGIAEFRSHFSFDSMTWLMTDEQGQLRNAAAPMRTGDRIWGISWAGYSWYCAQVLIYGDVNGDGSIKMTDLITVRNVILGDKRLDNVFARAADVTGDGMIKMTDLIRIRNHILGDTPISQEIE